MSAPEQSGSAPLTVRDLRRRWRPRKLKRPDSSTNIRIHRACSWLEQGQNLIDADNPDLALVSNWIGLNALYGQWDDQLNQPSSDRESLYGFFDRILALDQNGRVETVLKAQRTQVMDVLGDPFLSRHFWDDPAPTRATKKSSEHFDARTWYVQGKWPMLCSRVLRRIYLLRCQLVHGAATHDGRLNRRAVEDCNTLLAGLTAAAIEVIADFGADEDWGSMCYPPVP